jgi:hypothetical protein
MVDAASEWVIEHVEVQTYDVISLLDYDATDVQMEGPHYKRAVVCRSY